MNKSDLLKYLGPIDSLTGYKRSYKLVFLRCLLDKMNSEGVARTDQVAAQFREFYLDRAEKGLPPDYDADSTISDIRQSTVPSVLSLIKANPYQAFAAAGIVTQKSVSGVDMFALDTELAKQLSLDKTEIYDVLTKKLDYYYFSERGQSMQKKLSLKDTFAYIMENYQQMRKSQPFTNNSMHRFFTKDAKSVISNLPAFNSEIHTYRASVGIGNWAAVPWIAVLDNRVSKAIREGIYLCYLLSKSGDHLYLTLNQGTTSILESKGKRAGYEELRYNAKSIREKIHTVDFVMNNDIELGNEDYETSTIFYKRYDKDALPSDDILVNDFTKMMNIFSKYQNELSQSSNNGDHKLVTEGSLVTDSGVAKHSVVLSHIKKYIASRGFTFPSDLVENFYLSVKSKPFVILAGISGTGKTRFVRLFAEAIGASQAAGNFKIVSVRPDWSDSSDLFGHTDLNGRFVPGLIIDFINRAIQEPERTFFLCLDEMNLARVEYYLSDILSVMESRCHYENEIRTDCLIDAKCFGMDSDSEERYAKLYLPSNLIMVGTVNMDETTFPFSKKVLDRANTIEFSYVDLAINETASATVEPSNVSSSFFMSEYVTLADCKIDTESVLHDIVDLLTEINVQLEPINAQIGYRVRDEICFYVLYNERFKLLNVNTAKDLAIKQKILPRIAGSNQSIRDTLIGLFKLCAGDNAINLHPDNLRNFEVMQQYLKDKNSANASAAKNGVLYPQSAHKIAFMMRRLEEDGFTTYWL